MPVPLPVNVKPIEMPTPASGEPTPEFIHMMEDLNRRTAGTPLNPSGVEGVTTAEPLAPLAPIAPPVVKQEDKPIILGYKYTGTCPSCHQDVSTLELDADGKHFAVAFCLFEKKQIESKEVVNLNGKEAKNGGSNIIEKISVPEKVRDLRKTKS
jgi:hypothetical protein